MKKNKTSMLDYTKKILKAVSFDQRLLLKEYFKSRDWLSTDEAKRLRAWVYRNYPNLKFLNIKEL